MWDIVWVSPQGHRLVSVSRYFLLQAPQCPCSVRKRFSRDHCCRGRSKQVANTHTRHCSLFIALYSITMTCCSCCHIVKVTTSVITGVKQGATAASQVDSTDVRSTSTPVAVMTELSHEYSAPRNDP